MAGVLPDHHAPVAQPAPLGYPLCQGWIEPCGIGGIGVNQIKGFRGPLVQPAPDFTAMHAHLGLGGLALGDSLQVGTGNGGDAPILVDGHHGAGPALQGFAGHHPAAAAQIQPAAAG